MTSTFRRAHSRPVFFIWIARRLWNRDARSPSYHDGMNRLQHDISLRVEGWPAAGKAASYSLDSRIFPDEASLLDYCRSRFGNGALRHDDGTSWTYHRRGSALPPLLTNLFTRLLNKSY